VRGKGGAVSDVDEIRVAKLAQALPCTRGHVRYLVKRGLTDAQVKACVAMSAAGLVPPTDLMAQHAERLRR
jgi:hypothetical protein